MTLSEFKSWFEGFTENLDSPPNEIQWVRIQARVKDITGTPITERIYVDRYRDYLDWPYLRRGAYGIGYSAACKASDGVGAAVLMNGKADAVRAFDGHTAMYAAGKAESVAA